MKDQSDEMKAYKIRNDALEIVNEAYRVKIEALEMLNENLRFLKEARAIVQSSAHQTKAPASVSGQLVAATGKRGRGRPRKIAGASAPATERPAASPKPTTGKRGRGRPRKVAGTSASVSGQPTAAAQVTGEKRGRGRPRKTGAAAVKPAAPKGHNGKKRGRKPKGYYDNLPAQAPAPVTASGEKRGRGRPKKAETTGTNGSGAGGKMPSHQTVNATGSNPVTHTSEAKRERKSKSSSITRLQVPLEASLREILNEDGYNKATFRGLTGILLCMFENGTATVSNLHEYIGGSRVTVVRHTALLKKMKMLTYEGSRKKGYYALTAQGRHLQQRLMNA
jgi:DNA-binding transcriptional ArsR family regulator